MQGYIDLEGIFKVNAGLFTQEKYHDIPEYTVAMTVLAI